MPVGAISRWQVHLRVVRRAQEREGKRYLNAVAFVLDAV